MSDNLKSPALQSTTSGFGGLKQSGFGREGGRYVMPDLTKPKRVTVGTEIRTDPPLRRR